MVAKKLCDKRVFLSIQKMIKMRELDLRILWKGRKISRETDEGLVVTRYGNEARYKTWEIVPTKCIFWSGFPFSKDIYTSWPGILSDVKKIYSLSIIRKDPNRTINDVHIVWQGRFFSKMPEEGYEELSKRIILEDYITESCYNTIVKIVKKMDYKKFIFEDGGAFIKGDTIYLKRGCFEDPATLSWILLATEHNCLKEFRRAIFLNSYDNLIQHI